LLTGILGSLILDYCGWPTVFRVIGFLGLAWTLILRYYTMSSNHNRVINISQPNRLVCSKLGQSSEDVPWLRLFGRSSFWACVLAHACEMNCFFVLLSWLPTYFHENFPLAKVSESSFLFFFEIFVLFFFLISFNAGLGGQYDTVVGVTGFYNFSKNVNRLFDLT
jgi:predicted MFS family arabinose efflux permease